MVAIPVIRKLAQLDDVAITSPADGDLAQYDAASGKWKNVPGGSLTAPGDITIQSDSGASGTGSVVILTDGGKELARFENYSYGGGGGLRITSPGTRALDIGTHAAMGAPTGTPSLADNGGGGNLSAGTYLYAYTETDNTGETTLSPAGSITLLASHSVIVTMPLGRRGVGSRKLYRTTAGGNTFKLLLNFQSGDGYFQTSYVDNTADASLGANAPSTDTTAFSNFIIDDQKVKFVGTSPGTSGPADLTLCTADPGVGGSFAIDAYGMITARVAASEAFYAQVTDYNGVTPYGFQVGRNLAAYGGVQATTFRIDGDGHITMWPIADNVGIRIFGAPTQTNDLIQLFTNANVLRFSIDPSGQPHGYDSSGVAKWYIGQSADFHGNSFNNYGGTGSYISMASKTNAVTVVAGSTSVATLIVLGIGSQASDLQEWRNSTPTTLLSVGAAGHLTFADGVNIIAGTTTGTQIGTVGGASGQKLGFWAATPIVQPVLATGASHVVDDVITVLQHLGLVRQA